MFTGLVEEKGWLEDIRGSLCQQADNKGEESAGMRSDGRQYRGKRRLFDRHLLLRSYFTADVMPETMKKTNLGRLKRGETINLERAMRMGDRFGGHIVSGHVDGTGEIVREAHANAVYFRSKRRRSIEIHGPARLGLCDGISLTLVEVADTWFSISIIPHTLAHTNLEGKSTGDMVNLECDVIGKYVERLMRITRIKATARSDRDG